MKTFDDIFRKFTGYNGRGRRYVDTRPQRLLHERPIHRREFVKCIGYAGMFPMMREFAEVDWSVSYADQSTRVLRGARTDVVPGDEQVMRTFGDGAIEFSELGIAAGGSGTANLRKVYRAANNELCTVVGGSSADIRHNYITMRGFRVDASLDPSSPATERGLDSMTGLGIRFEQMHFDGTYPRHLGYAYKANKDGSVATGDEGGGPGGGAFRQAGGDQTLYQCLVEGFRESFGSVLTSLTLDQCIIRHCFNGPAFGNEAAGVGSLLHVRDSAIIEVVNHLHSLKARDSGTVIFDNNVVCIAQNIWGATGTSWKGADVLRVTRCTYYAPPEQPGWKATSYMAGGSCDNVRDEVTIADNIFNMRNSVAISAVSRQLGILSEHHNLVCQRVQPNTAKYMRLDGVDYGLPGWRAATGKASTGSLFNVQPVYVSGPAFAGAGPPNPGNTGNNFGWDRPMVVHTVGNIRGDLDTYRAWFALRSGSPGKNAASDGLDIGIRTIV